VAALPDSLSLGALMASSLPRSSILVLFSSSPLPRGLIQGGQTGDQGAEAAHLAMIAEHRWRRDQKGAGLQEGVEAAAALSFLNQTSRERGSGKWHWNGTFDTPDETGSGRAIAAAIRPSVRCNT